MTVTGRLGAESSPQEEEVGLCTADLSEKAATQAEGGAGQGR